MTVKIVLEFPDLISADAMLHRLAARGPESEAAPASQSAQIAQPETAAVESVPASPLPAKPRKRGRKSNAEKQALQASKELAAQQPIQTAAEDVHKALHKVFDATGIPGKPEDRCFAILARNGADRISQIQAKPEVWAQFVADCDAALAGKDFTKAAA